MLFLRLSSFLIKACKKVGQEDWRKTGTAAWARISPSSPLPNKHNSHATRLAANLNARRDCRFTELQSLPIACSSSPSSSPLLPAATCAIKKITGLRSRFRAHMRLPRGDRSAYTFVLQLLYVNERTNTPSHFARAKLITNT